MPRPTNDEEKAAPSPHRFRVVSRQFSGPDGKECRIGDVVDLSHVSPERVRKLVSTRLVLPEAEYQRSRRHSALSELKDEERTAMTDLGLRYSNRLKHELRDLGVQFDDMKAAALADLERKLIAERDAELKDLLGRYRERQLAVKDAPDNPTPPAAA